MPRLALDTLLLGDHGELHAGDEIPSSFTVGGDGPHQTDFERLEALGCVEPVKARAKAKASDPDES